MTIKTYRIIGETRLKRVNDSLCARRNSLKENFYIEMFITLVFLQINL